MGRQGNYFGVERKKVKEPPKTKLTVRQRLQQIVGITLLEDPETIGDKFPVAQEVKLMGSFADLCEIAVEAEREFGLPHIFTEENEEVFATFGSLLAFVESSIAAKAVTA